jgi:CTP synthase
VELEYIDSEQVEQQGADVLLRNLDAVLVPGGFGDRGSEGKIAAIGYARTNRIPFFGICLGMHCAVVEFARNVAGLAGANSREFDKDAPYMVIDLLPDQRTVRNKGATMRLGAYPCVLAAGSVAAEAYGTTEISERHRHRYEFSNDFRDRLEGAGLVLSGTSPDKRLVEMIELADHPFFVGCQFHPEFKSRPVTPHPLFAHFVRAALARQAMRTKADPRSQPESLPAIN